MNTKQVILLLITMLVVFMVLFRGPIFYILGWLMLRRAVFRFLGEKEGQRVWSRFVDGEMSATEVSEEVLKKLKER